MKTYFCAYAISATIFVLLDFIWLSLMTGSVYKPQIGHLLLDKPNILIFAIFYLLYPIGMTIISIHPNLETLNWPHALAIGALLGLIAYGTYDLTNLGTLKGWTLTISVVDAAWGTVATGLASAATVLIFRYGHL